MAVKPKLPSGKGQSNVGELNAAGKGGDFAKPYYPVPPGIGDMNSIKNDIGERSGFESDANSYIVKKGMVYGEAAKLNCMPPGMDISNQDYADIRDMPLKKITGMDYPGDGWGEGESRDVREDTE